jgi:hypothetical protein
LYINGGLQSARGHIIQDIAGHQERKHGYIHPIAGTSMAAFIQSLGSTLRVNLHFLCTAS